MYATERHDVIRTILASDGRASVAEVARRLDVTSETVRRDFDQLERLGHLRRVHGGAVSTARTTVLEPTLVDRDALHTDAKMRIAQAAARFIPSTFTGSVLVDAGTTTGRLAALLSSWRPEGPSASLDVITNSVPIAAALQRNQHLSLHLLGGRMRPTTGAAVGASTVDQLDAVRPDIAFLGANGVSSGFGLSTPDELESAVKAAMTRAARRRILLADASKLGEETLHRFAALDDIDALITDAEPDADLAEALEAAQVEVIVT